MDFPLILGKEKSGIKITVDNLVTLTKITSNTDVLSKPISKPSYPWDKNCELFLQ